MVDGRMVYRDGRVLGFDEAAVIRSVPETLKRVLERAGVPQTPR